jgi:hypothetical protein
MPVPILGQFQNLAESMFIGNHASIMALTDKLIKPYCIVIEQWYRAGRCQLSWALCVMCGKGTRSRSGPEQCGRTCIHEQYSRTDAFGTANRSRA